MTHSSLPNPVTASRFSWADTSIKYHFWIISAEMKGGGLWLQSSNCQSSCIYFSYIGPGWLILSAAFDGLYLSSFPFYIYSVQFIVLHNKEFIFVFVYKSYSIFEGSTQKQAYVSHVRHSSGFHLLKNLSETKFYFRRDRGFLCN